MDTSRPIRQPAHFGAVGYQGRDGASAHPSPKETTAPKVTSFASVKFGAFVKELTMLTVDPLKERSIVTKVAKTVASRHNIDPKSAANYGLEGWHNVPNFGMKCILLLAKWLDTKGQRLGP